MALGVVLNGQVSSQKTIIDFYDFIEVLDSSELDTSYSPVFILKEDIKFIRKDPRYKDGPVQVFINNMPGGRFSDGDYTFDHREFNDFSNNGDLLNYLVKCWKRDYYVNKSYDASDNLTENKIRLIWGSDSALIKRDTFEYDGSNNLIRHYTVEE